MENCRVDVTVREQTLTEGECPRGVMQNRSMQVQTPVALLR